MTINGLQDLEHFDVSVKSTTDDYTELFTITGDEIIYVDTSATATPSPDDINGGGSFSGRNIYGNSKHTLYSWPGHGESLNYSVSISGATDQTELYADGNLVGIGNGSYSGTVNSSLYITADLQSDQYVIDVSASWSVDLPISASGESQTDSIHR